MEDSDEIREHDDHQGHRSAAADTENDVASNVDRQAGAIGHRDAVGCFNDPSCQKNQGPLAAFVVAQVANDEARHQIDSASASDGQADFIVSQADFPSHRREDDREADVANIAEDFGEREDGEQHPIHGRTVGLLLLFFFLLPFNGEVVAQVGIVGRDSALFLRRFADDHRRHEDGGDEKMEDNARCDQGAASDRELVNEEGDDGREEDLADAHSGHTESVGQAQLAVEALTDHNEGGKVNAGERDAWKESRFGGLRITSCSLHSLNRNTFP